ncbi:MAG TPA: hypothetical protein EYP28_02445, partial [Methanophagales archaeon]|nr:hypothetical protein [Methanophagales archaeon]
MFDLHTQSISSIVAIGETRTKFISALAEKISNPEHQNTNKFQILIPKQTFCYAKTFTKNNFTKEDFTNNGVWPIYEEELQMVPSNIDSNSFSTIDVFGHSQIT